MFSVWEFVLRIIAREALLNMGRELSIPSCQYLQSASKLVFVTFLFILKLNSLKICNLFQRDKRRTTGDIVSDVT